MLTYDLAENEEAALERLHRDQCTDGLPVVIPPRQRVDAMVLAGGYDGDMSLGAVSLSLARSLARFARADGR